MPIKRRAPYMGEVLNYIFFPRMMREMIGSPPLAIMAERGRVYLVGCCMALRKAEV
jgi:hypothetical protein